jgi:hypothetical protein
MKRLILSTIFLAGRVFAADPAEVLKEADRSFAALSAKEGPGRAFHDFTGKDKEGKATTSHSRYVTIWRKQPDGSWKFIFDGGVPQP